jgi:hypothetical protein
LLICLSDGARLDAGWPLLNAASYNQLKKSGHPRKNYYTPSFTFLSISTLKNYAFETNVS